MGTAFPRVPLEITPEMLLKNGATTVSRNTYLDKYDKRNDYFIFS